MSKKNWHHRLKNSESVHFDFQKCKLHSLVVVFDLLLCSCVLWIFGLSDSCINCYNVGSVHCRHTYVTK